MTRNLTFRFIHAGMMSILGLASMNGFATKWETDVTGSHRTFNENISNVFRPGRTGDENLLSFRTNLKLESRNGPWSVVAEIQDSRAYGIDDTRSLNGGSVNAMEPIQYYVQYNRNLDSEKYDSLQMKAGRFTAKLGNGRLIGHNGYRNTLFDFFGSKAKLSTNAGNSVEAFWMMAGQIRPGSADELDDNRVRHDRFDDDLWVAGFYTENVELIPDAQTRAYLMTLQEDDTPGKRESANRELFTVGAQILKTPKTGGLDYDIEGAFQTGSRRATRSASDTDDLDVRAYFVHAALGYTFTEVPVNVAFTYDFATGDDSPNDGGSNLYDPYFGPIKGDLGPTGQFTLVHRNNLSAPGIRVKYKNEKSQQMFFHWQAVWLDSSTAPFGRIGVQDETGESGDFAGHQLHASAKTPVWFDGLTLELGAVHFNNGEFFKNAPNATGNGDPQYIYTMLSYSF